MAVRTVTIYTAKKLRLKRSSRPGNLRGRKRAPNFFGKTGKIFELIGKPFYWILSLTFFLLFRLSLFFLNSLVKFKKKAFAKIRLPSKKIVFLIFCLFSLFSICYLLFTIFSGLPNPNKLISRDQILSTKIYDQNGTLLYKIYRRQNRTLVELKDIPPKLTAATIAIEDAEFYNHHGFSLKGMLRAFLRNLSGQKLSGGSTITQQLVKNALLTPEKTLSRKIKEIILAFLVETKFSKDEILQMYLNEVGYGGTAYGIEEASQTYFGKPVHSLNLAESALLAGLPASPTTFSPFGVNPEKAKERQRLVLRRMREEGFISEDEEGQTVAQEITFAPQKTDIRSPHFVMYVKNLLVQEYGEKMVEEGGLEVTTSIDLNIQNEAQKILTNEVEQLKNLRITNAAALITNPQTGEILAMVGSKDYFDPQIDGNVNVTIRSRQPGSAIKPVNYSLALENGFTAGSILSDTPITFFIPGQPPYSPRNYDGRFHGLIPLRIALASSYNVPAVKVLSALGVERMIKRGQEMGITTWEDPSRFGLSLTLGGGEIKMTDLAVVYGTLANMGQRVNLRPILEIRNFKGKILEKTKSDFPSLTPGKRVFSPDVAYILTNILSDNSARTPAFGPHSWLNILNHPHVAVKTGTTQNLRDNWTIGYTPDYLAAVWVGNNDNTPMSWVASGITGASPIWNKIMNLLLKDIPDKEFPRPEDLKEAEICSLTGTLPCEGCPTKKEFFLPEFAPTTHCDPEKIKEILQKNSQTPTPPH